MLHGRINTAAVPMDGWDDILKFLPTGPNFKPFESFASAVSAFGALLLAVATIVGIIGVLWNFAAWAIASVAHNPQKAGAAKSGLRTSAIILLVAGVAWGVIIAFIVAAGKTIF